jgi:polysaccharide pyruvyl transferase WcaK-like protein
MRTPVVGIFGHYGNENLGDEAIIQACVQRMPEHIPGVELRLFSSKPQDSESRYGLPAYPIRYLPPGTLTPSEQIALERERKVDHTGQSKLAGSKPNPVKRLLKSIPFLWTLLRAVKSTPRALVAFFRECRFLWVSRRRVKSLDLLVVTGSNQFLDNFGGPWGFPYTLMKWTWLAWSAGVPVAYASVGAGPLDEKASFRLIRLALRKAKFLSFRDEPSRTLVDPDGRFNGKVFPDIAFAIDYPIQAKAPSYSDDYKPIVAINAMAVYDARYWYIKDPVRYQAYVEKLTQFVQDLDARGYRPMLFATQVKDRNVIKDILDGLRGAGCGEDFVSTLYHEHNTVDDMLSFLQSTDIVVPTRFHGTVLGLWAGKPTIGICYYRKAADLLGEFGQERFAFDIDSVTVDKLNSAVDDAWSDHAAIAERIEQQVVEYRKDLAKQFTELVALLPN